MFGHNTFVRTLLCLSSIIAFSQSVHAQEFRLLAWNIESSRPGQEPSSDPETIGKELIALLKDPATRAQLVALSEVDPKSMLTMRMSAVVGMGGEVELISSASGGFKDSDSLALLVDKTRFDVDEAIELHRFGGIVANVNVQEEDSEDFGALRARSPLAVRLIDKETKQTFWVIVNHLARGEADLRADQARMLRKWAEAHDEPIIAAGDFNFDYDFHTQKGNEGFDAMFEGDTWQWVKPDPLVDSNWSQDRRITDRDVDRYPDSILDFIIVANGAKDWKPESDVIVREGDFPDDEKTSDHRPLIGIFHPGKN
ncbi:MAG: hypothetical protein R3C03_16775 [Pirellulaceae bacterium]